MVGKSSCADLLRTDCPWFRSWRVSISVMMDILFCIDGDALCLIDSQGKFMPKAIWNGSVIAEAKDNEVEIVEGNVYFPMSAVHQQYLQTSAKVTHCPWKGAANYYDLVVNGETNSDAVWTYRQPLAAAKQIAGFVAFWRGVQVEK